MYTCTGTAIPNRAPPTCRLGARAGLAGGQPLEHATQLVDLNNTAPCSGTLTSWRYCHYPITGAVRFQVWRRRGALQLDLVHSQSFPIFSSNGQKDLACETYRLPKAEYFRVLSRDVFGAYVEHSHDEVIAVHVSKSRDLSQLYQLAAVTEPNLIEISNLSILNRAVLHLSADIQPDRGGFGKLKFWHLMSGGGGGGGGGGHICNCYSINMFAFLADPSALSIRFMQRAALQAKLAQGFDHNQDSPQNTGLSRYAYSHWGILIAVLAPLAVLSVPIIGVLLCCKSQSHPNNKCAAIDENPTSKQSKRIGMDFILIIYLSMLSTPCFLHTR